jgi:ABC-2 type transport system permease protein
MWTWLLMLVVVVMLLVFTVAVSMILSSLYPRFRDVSIIWTVASTALFYATPVLYSLDAIHSHTMSRIIALNPLTPILALARRWIIDPHAPNPISLSGGTWRLLISIAIYLVICGAAVTVFRREAPRIAEVL